MRLTIEKHGKGYSVRENGFAGDYHETLCAASTVDEALSFIRECMNPPVEPDPRGEPEGEGEKGEAWLRGDKFTQEEIREAMAKVTDKDCHAALSRNLPPLATPTDPPWKRAKVGDWIRARDPEDGSLFNAEITAVKHFGEGCRGFRIKRFGGKGLGEHISSEIVAEIIERPFPPRHGDFGSMGEEAN